MRLLPLSDLHLEFHADGGAEFASRLDGRGVDALLLAGDIGVWRTTADAVATLRLFTDTFPLVVFVPGNHEYYRGSPHSVDALLERAAAELPNLHILAPNHPLDLGSRRIHGATLWFPDQPDNERYAHLLNDFRLIDDFVPWVYERHLEAREYFAASVREGDVVVTHHAPSLKSTPPRFAGELLNRFFASDLESLIRDTRPAVWLHGHMHDRVDYRIGETRVLCNPLGYPREPKAQFDERLILEL